MGSSLLLAILLSCRGIPVVTRTCNSTKGGTSVNRPRTSTISVFPRLRLASRVSPLAILLNWPSYRSLENLDISP
jgi:hypothetical protein